LKIPSGWIAEFEELARADDLDGLARLVVDVAEIEAGGRTLRKAAADIEAYSGELNKAREAIHTVIGKLAAYRRLRSLRLTDLERIGAELDDIAHGYGEPASRRRSPPLGRPKNEFGMIVVLLACAFEAKSGRKPAVAEHGDFVDFVETVWERLPAADNARLPPSPKARAAAIRRELRSRKGPDTGRWGQNV
jgi:hypothetical protein